MKRRLKSIDSNWTRWRLTLLSIMSSAPVEGLDVEGRRRLGDVGQMRLRDDRTRHHGLLEEPALLVLQRVA